MMVRHPHVYRAIAAITGALSAEGIAKAAVNASDGYAYRSIDAVYRALSPLLARHKLCILPRILERGCVERRGIDGGALFYVTVRAAFDLVSARDGSCHSIATFGEALDQSDKATAKALSAAYKSAMLQAFCVPSEGDHEADATTLRTIASSANLIPVQGWEQWASDIADVARSCETGEALTRLQNSNRTELRTLATAEPALYAAIGEAIRSRRAEVAPASERAAA